MIGIHNHKPRHGNKTKIKADKRQCHHFDANILITAVNPNELNYDKYTRVIASLVNGQNRYGGMCIATLGEVYKRIMNFDNEEVRISAYQFLDKYISKKKIKVYTVNYDVIHKLDELKGIESRCHAPELIALAVAIINNGTVFITDDLDIQKSLGLKKYLNGIIKIVGMGHYEKYYLKG